MGEHKQGCPLCDRQPGRKHWPDCPRSVKRTPRTKRVYLNSAELLKWWQRRVVAGR